MGSELSESGLIRDLRAGRESTAERVVARYTKPLLAAARRQMGRKLSRRVDPEDVVQSAYGSLFRRLRRGDYELADSEALWRLLVTMTLNKVRGRAKFHGAARRDMLREESAGGRTVTGADAERRDGGPTASYAVMFQEEVAAFLAKVPARDREIVELRLRGSSTAEIAKRVSRAERSVRRVLQRAQMRLERGAQSGGDGGGR